MLRTIAAIALALSATFSALTPTEAVAEPGADSGGDDSSTRPNVLLILTDDMRADDLAYMPHTQRLIAGHGTEFTDAVSPHPLCCPARAELLTGQYAQNSGLRHNAGPHGGMAAFTGWDNTLPVWLKAAGYRTGYTGKLFNGYRGGDLPGWNRFDPFTEGVYRPFGFKTWNDGSPGTVPGVHTTDYTNDETVRMINKFSGDTPFFIWAGHSAPHKRKGGGVRAPDRYLTSHLDTQPTFGTAEDSLDVDLFRQRLQALQAVDEAVRDAVRALRAKHELASTLIVFTSDNGFLLGEGGLHAKNQPQEGSLRVPLVLRGPGVPVGRSDALSSILDIPATITDATGATPGRLLDGADLLGQRVADRDAVLIQAGSTVAEWEWRGIRTRTHTYVAYDGTGTEVLWDRVADPNERTDLVPGSPPELDLLRERLAVLANCSGKTCG